MTRDGAPARVTAEDIEAALAAPQEAPPPTWAAAHPVMVESDALAALVRDRLLATGTVVVVPPAADPVLLRSEPRVRSVGNPLHLLSAGPLSWTRGYEFALQAVGLLGERGIECVYRIAGAGSHVDAIAFARHQLGLDDRVELLPPADPEALRSQLAWADVLVDASVLVESPRTLLDAQAAGVPVVTTQPPADVPESVLSVPPRDPAALCDALQRLAGDDELRARLVRAGRERAAAAPTEAEYEARCREAVAHA